MRHTSAGNTGVNPSQPLSRLREGITPLQVQVQVLPLFGHKSLNLFKYNFFFLCKIRIIMLLAALFSGLEK